MPPCESCRSAFMQARSGRVSQIPRFEVFVFPHPHVNRKRPRPSSFSRVSHRTRRPRQQCTGIIFHTRLMGWARVTECIYVFLPGATTDSNRVKEIIVDCAGDRPGRIQVRRETVALIERLVSSSMGLPQLPHQESQLSQRQCECSKTWL